MSQEDLQLIEQYFEGVLDGQALEDFHVKMKTDESFAKAVEMEKDLMDGVEFFGNEKLRQELERIGQEEVGGGKIKNIKSGRRRFLWSAAAVLTLAVVAKFAFDNTQKTTDEIYAEYAVHEFDFTEMSNAGNKLPEIERLLKSEKYGEALPLIENYLGENPDAHGINLAYGVALLELNKYGEAHAVFDSIVEKVPALKYDALWYEALTYLREGEVEGCKIKLLEISKESARYRNAKELLVDL